MKKGIRLFVCAIIVLCILLTFISVYAQWQKYTIDDISLSVTIPDNYAVVTRDIDENDPNLTVFARTKDDMLSFMETSNMYLDAFDKNTNQEIVITGIDNYLMDFNNVSDDMLREWMEELKSTYESNGGTYIKSDIYDNGQIKFLKVYLSQIVDNDTIYGLQYYTVYNHRAINITIHSYAQITEELEEEMKVIIDSTDFNVGVNTDTVSSANDYGYIDNDTNLSFTVPANYTQEALSGERDIYKVKFVNNEKKDLCILYGSSDIYKEMSVLERLFISRSDVNNSQEIEDGFKEGLDEALNESVISLVEPQRVFYGDKEYYKYNVKATSEHIGIEIQVDMSMLIHVENGYAYIFQFCGREDSPYYADFEKLLGSVKYPGYSYNSYLADYNKSLLFGIILTILIYSLPIIIYRYAIRREPVKPSTAKKITIIYGIAAFVVMSVILISLGGEGAGTAIILWSFVNYRTLISGYTEQKYIDNKESQILNSKTKKISFCYTCQKCKNKFKVSYNMPEYKTDVPDLETVCPKCKSRQIIHSEELTCSTSDCSS